MERPAVWRFGLIAIVFFGCVHRDEPRVPITNHLEPGPVDLTGPYWCSIDESGYDYARMPCMIRKIGDNFILAKLGGSQRFTGVVTPTADGFTFVGKLYCPWGDCNQPLHGQFRAAANNELQGKFTDDPMTVRLVHAPAGAFGGASYGGAAYGGDGYGGDPWAIAR